MFNDSLLYPTLDFKVNAIYDNLEYFIEQCFSCKYSLQMKSLVEECLFPLQYRYRLKELLRKSIFAPYICKEKEKHKSNGISKQNIYWKGVYLLYFVLVMALSGVLWNTLYKEERQMQNETLKLVEEIQKQSNLLRGGGGFMTSMYAEAVNVDSKNVNEFVNPDTDEKYVINITTS